MKKIFFTIVISFSLATVQSQITDSILFRKLFDETMLHGEAYNNLHILTKNIGNRLAGSPQAEMAVAWGKEILDTYGLDSVWLQPCMVPHWVRGQKEFGEIIFDDGTRERVDILALGNSIATATDGLIADIIECKDFDEMKKMGAEKIKGKIVFFNHEFPQNVINSFDGYGEAGPYRWYGASEASKLGASGVIIRSVSSAYDNFAHTGSTHFDDGVKEIPCAALSTMSADHLHTLLTKNSAAKFKMILNCKMLDDVKSYNVIGEIRGSEFPNEVIVVGGHLDSWDVGEGAQDDGAGVVQSIEVLRTLKALHIIPKRTIRCVLFMNEENGARGGKTYGDYAKNALYEKPIAALESDAGGFSPRGFAIDSTFNTNKKLSDLKKLFITYGVYNFTVGHGGTDIGPLETSNTRLFGLSPDSQRYMDIHHTNNDVFENVNKRELHFGAATMTMLCWWLSEYGTK